MTPSESPTETFPAGPSGEMLPGRLFAGRYRIERLLGKGSFGGVYRARDEVLARSVALKVVHRIPGGKDGDLDALLAEARTAAQLDHPHLLPVYDAGVEMGSPWISSRLIAGRSLREILKEGGPLPPKRALRLLLQAASGLSHAHAREIVHRDIKPGNLLLETREDGTDHLWIADFGIAKLLREVAETTGCVIGTPAFMAPEQATGKKVDGRADIFALGCVAAELLTAQQVFDGASIPEVLYAIVHHDPALSEVEERAGAGIAAMIRRCLAKSPDDRWQSMDDLGAELHRLTAPASPLRRFAALGRLFRRRSPLSWDHPVAAGGVRKRYGFGRPVLDGVDLSIERGAVYSLLGRNGCGKTTFIRTLLGIYRRDAGNIALFGRDPQGGDPEVLAHVGFVPDTLAVDPGMRVREVLDCTSRLYRRWDRAWCHQLLARYDLPLEAKIRHLSRGSQTKVSLVLALAHRPALLVLDDPTLGLDAIVLSELVETLEEVVREEGTTALLASHNYEALEQVATHIGLFRNGRIEISDTLDGLRRRVREVTLKFFDNVPDLRGVDGFRIQKTDGLCVTGWATNAPETLDRLRSLGPGELESRELSLREIFVGLLR